MIFPVTINVYLLMKSLNELIFFLNMSNNVWISAFFYKFMFFIKECRMSIEKTNIILSIGFVRNT